MDISSLALSFPEATKKPHFKKISFRVRDKIFATLNAEMNVAVLKLSEIDQDIYSKMSEGAMAPVANKWGSRGWTQVDTHRINKQLLTDALKAAYCMVAPRELVDKLQ